MKDKHLQIRIEQCLSLAQASPCRHKQAAMLLDPARNVILADGYKGGPRGAKGSLCGDYFCLREGFQREQVKIRKGWRHEYERVGGSRQVPEIAVDYGDTERVQAFSVPVLFQGHEDWEAKYIAKAEARVDEMVAKYPPIEPGEQVGRGCHHAEMNVLMNAAAQGVSTQGAWLIVLDRPCLVCAKLIHHAGIAKVLIILNGGDEDTEGTEYLDAHDVIVQEFQKLDPEE